jgi:hypothetical protein
MTETRCPVCKGKTKIMCLGMLEKTCPRCKGGVISHDRNMSDEQPRPPVRYPYGDAKTSKALKEVK